MPSVDEALQILAKYTLNELNPRTQSAAPGDFEALTQSVYVWPKGHEFVTREAKDLTQMMANFLASKQQRIAVLVGDPGSGKTLFAQRWLLRCLKAWHGDAGQPLPFFIRLSTIQDPGLFSRSKQDLLAWYLKKK